MTELIQDANVQAATFAEFVIGLALVVTGFFVARFINILAGTLMIIFGSLVIAL